MTENIYAVLIIENDFNNPQFLLIRGNRKEFVAKDNFFLPEINKPNVGKKFLHNQCVFQHKYHLKPQP